MKRTPPRNWPFYISSLLLLLLVWLTLDISIRQNHGNLVYALDDAYIHMAMAKNFSQSAVWGVTRYGFTPTSSSLAWTLLLSLTYYLGGVNQLAPLLWNILFAVLILASAEYILSWYNTPAWIRLGTLLGIVLLVPLPTLVLSGMEQSLQTLVSMLALFLAARLFSGESPRTARRDAVILLFLAALITAVRFEGMVLIVAFLALFLRRRRWVYAFSLATCGFLPVLINGLVSVSKGWFWLPTSVLLKAKLPTSHSPLDIFLSLLNSFYVAMREGPHVFVLLVSILLVYIAALEKGSAAHESRQTMGAILFLAGIAHLEFVGASPLYRYDAYFCALAFLYIGLQLPIIVPIWPSPRSLSTWTAPRNLACAALVLLFVVPNVVKGGRLLWYLPECTNNIYEQQYQMGQFVLRYYQNSTIALNDIGAVNFFADIRCLDLWGLANEKVAEAKFRHSYQVIDIEQVSKQNGGQIAIVYDNWFKPAIPPEWTRVGRWTIRNDVIAGADTVSFYAMEPTEVSRLSESLIDFSPHLPDDVIQRGH